MSLFKKCTSNNRAKIVDGKLILSFPGAITPVVWQMDLNGAQASALEVKAQGNNHSLKLKTPKGESTTIASFKTKKEAVNSLMAAAKALENAQGKINTETNPIQRPIKPKEGFIKKTITILGILAILFILYSFTIALTGATPGTTQISNNGATTSNPDNDGMAVSADDFLKGR